MIVRIIKKERFKERRKVFNEEISTVSDETI